MTDLPRQDGLHPNTFQTPNLLVDRLLELLNDNELRIAIFTIRHLYGWPENRRAGQVRLSVTAFERGHRGSKGCGLARATILETLATMEKFGIMRRVGRTTQKGRAWAFAESERDIDWEGLERRLAAREATNRSRTEKARAARHGKHPGGSSGQSDRPALVSGTDRNKGQSDRPALVSATDQTGVSPTDPIETKSFETHSDDVNQPDHHQLSDTGARAREVLAAHYDRLGIAESVWAQWRQHPPEHQLACILHARGEGANPPGLLRTMLDGDGKPLPKYIERAQLLLNPQPVPGFQGAGTSPAEEPISLDERPGGRLTVREIWQATLGQLQLQLNRDTFSQLKSAQPVRFEAGILTVHPQQPYAVHTFVRLQEMLDQVVSRVAGVDVRVRCENGVEPTAHEGAAGSGV